MRKKVKCIPVTLVHSAEVGWAEVVEPEQDVRDHDVRECDILPSEGPLQEGLSTAVGPLLVRGPCLGQLGVLEKGGKTM